MGIAAVINSAKKIQPIIPHRYTRADRRVSVPLKGAYIKISLAWLASILVVTPYTSSLTMNHAGVCGTEWSTLQYYSYYMVYISLSCFVPALVLIVIQARLAYLLSTRVSDVSAMYPQCTKLVIFGGYIRSEKASLGLFKTDEKP